MSWFEMKSLEVWTKQGRSQGLSKDVVFFMVLLIVLLFPLPLPPQLFNNLFVHGSISRAAFLCVFLLFRIIISCLRHNKVTHTYSWLSAGTSVTVREGCREGAGGACIAK